jgi:hypothetical protein
MPILDANEIMYKAFEPKVKNRFIMYLDGIPSFEIKTSTAPKFTDNVIKLDHINTYRKVRGKREWGDMEITLYDPLVPSASKAVMEWARLGYESVTGRAGYSDFYKKDFTFNVLGPAGEIVSEWVIKGAFIADGDFGDYDWSDDNFVELSITIAYDHAILNF